MNILIAAFLAWSVFHTPTVYQIAPDGQGGFVRMDTRTGVIERVEVPK